MQRLPKKDTHPGVKPERYPAAACRGLLRIFAAVFFVAGILVALLPGCGGGGGGMVRDVVPSGDLTYAPSRDLLAEGWNVDELPEVDGVAILTDSFMFSVDTSSSFRVSGKPVDLNTALAKIAADTGYENSGFSEVPTPIPNRKIYQVPVADDADVLEEMGKFEQQPNVDEIIPHALLEQPGETYEITGTARVADRLAADFSVSDWATKKINLPDYDTYKNVKERTVRVAILDTGLDPNHPALQGLASPSLNVSDYQDLGWHGTFIAGIIAAASKNSSGAATNIMRGVAEGRVELLPIVVCNGKGQCPYSYVMAGLKQALDLGADVINMSLCGDTNVPGLQAAIEATAQQALVVASACNRNEDAGQYLPAAASGVFTVGATDRNDHRASETQWGAGLGSNYGSVVDVAAPGDDIISTLSTALPGNSGIYYALADGTSFSAGFVSGLAALVMSLDASYTPSQTRSFILNTVDPILTDRPIGQGRIDAGDAFETSFPQGLSAVNLTVDCEPPIISPDQSATCTAHASNQYGLEITAQDPLWSASGGGTISSDGVFTATAPGAATITLNASGLQAETSVEIVSPNTQSVCGELTQDTTWWASYDYYSIDCNVEVPAGMTLTIKPGAVIKFNGAFSITVRGSLSARGTSSNYITVTSTSDSNSGATAFHFPGNTNLENSRIEYMNITKTATALLVESAWNTLMANYLGITQNTGGHACGSGLGGAVVNSGKLQIWNSEFLSNVPTATNIRGSAVCNSGSLYMYNSLINTNGAASTYGAVANAAGAIATLIEAEFHANTGTAGAVYNLGEMSMERSALHYNDGTVVINDTGGDLDLEHCAFTDNDDTNIYHSGNVLNISNTTMYGSYAGTAVDTSDSGAMSLTILNSIITDYAVGVSTRDTSLLQGNNIFDNEQYNLVAKSGSISATGNWWGSSVDAEIRSKFQDINDSPSLGTISYTPTLTTASATAGAVMD